MQSRKWVLVPSETQPHNINIFLQPKHCLIAKPSFRIRSTNSSKIVYSAMKTINENSNVYFSRDVSYTGETIATIRRYI